MPTVICSKCGIPYPETGTPFSCPDCGGLFDYDGPFIYDTSRQDKTAPGIWKYRHSFCLPPSAPDISLGEGNTPLVWVNLRGQKIGLKMESLNPSGSYKDRGTALTISHLVSRGVTGAIEDSSGNAGASFAAYAASAGIKARVFVPDYASGPKKNQIEQYGAELVKIPGPRSAAAEAVLKEAKTGIPYASHAYLPFGLPGIATIAYELWETLDAVPAAVIAPVGHGGLLLGIVRGFDALFKQKLISDTPFYVGVQAANMAPLAEAFHKGIEAAGSIKEDRTIAEGVSVRNPSRMQALIREIPRDNGQFIAIEEEEILPAYQQLARMGIYVEPTSALVFAALNNISTIIKPGPIIMIMSGSGLKYQP